MTANLRRWEPTGTNGADVAATDSPLLSSVTKALDGWVKYKTGVGFSRGTDTVISLSSGTTDAAQAYVVMPLGSILTSAAAAGAATVTVGTSIAAGTSVIVDAAGTAETRTVNAVSGSGPYTLTLSSALSSAHSTGALVTPVGLGVASQLYLRFKKFPTAGTLTGVMPFLDIIQPGGRLIRGAVDPTGLVTIQNTTGGNTAALADLDIDQVICLELDCLPGTKTATPFDGYGALRVYNDDGTLFANPAPITTGNYGIVQATSMRLGDATTTANGPYGMEMEFWGPAVDNSAAVPDIPLVSKTVVAATASWEELAWTGTAWA